MDGEDSAGRLQGGHLQERVGARSMQGIQGIDVSTYPYVDKALDSRGEESFSLAHRETPEDSCVH